jgi:hypothetical protein
MNIKFTGGESMSTYAWRSVQVQRLHRIKLGERESDIRENIWRNRPKPKPQLDERLYLSKGLKTLNLVAKHNKPVMKVALNASQYNLTISRKLILYYKESLIEKIKLTLSNSSQVLTLSRPARQISPQAILKTSKTSRLRGLSVAKQHLNANVRLNKFTISSNRVLNIKVVVEQDSFTFRIPEKAVLSIAARQDLSLCSPGSVKLTSKSVAKLAYSHSLQSVELKAMIRVHPRSLIAASIRNLVAKLAKLNLSKPGLMSKPLMIKFIVRMPRRKQEIELAGITHLLPTLRQQRWAITHGAYTTSLPQPKHRINSAEGLLGTFNLVPVISLRAQFTPLRVEALSLQHPMRSMTPSEVIGDLAGLVKGLAAAPIGNGSPSPLTVSGAGDLLTDILAERIVSGIFEDPGDAEIVIADEGLPQVLAKRFLDLRNFKVTGGIREPLDWSR